jgi:hypothetical protein
MVAILSSTADASTSSEKIADSDSNAISELRYH